VFTERGEKFKVTNTWWYCEFLGTHALRNHFRLIQSFSCNGPRYFVVSEFWKIL